jgi:hypothetical protein
MKPKFTHFLQWLLVQKDNHFKFESPTDCVVARFVSQTEKKLDEKLEFEGGNWSSMFPGDSYEERLRNYHWLCGTAPTNYKCVLLRASMFI